MSHLQRIRFMIDMDGFMVNRNFLCKELAIGNMNDMSTQLYRFKVGSYYDIPEEQRFQIKWVRKYIHGLYYHDYVGDFDAEFLISTLLVICNICDINNWLIGYKGGQHEYNILKFLGYDHLAYNIELVDCPKVEHLIRNNIAVVDTCKRHSLILHSNGLYVPAYCPKVKLSYFMAYLKSLTSQ